MKKILCCALLTGALFISGCSAKTNNLANKYYFVNFIGFLYDAINDINSDSDCFYFNWKYGVVTYKYVFTFFDDGLVSYSKTYTNDTYYSSAYIKIRGENVTNWKIQEDDTLFLFNADGDFETYQKVDSIEDYIALDHNESLCYYFYNGKVLILEKGVYSTTPEPLTPKDFGITKACAN